MPIAYSFNSSIQLIKKHCWRPTCKTNSAHDFLQHVASTDTKQIYGLQKKERKRLQLQTLQLQ